MNHVVAGSPVCFAEGWPILLAIWDIVRSMCVSPKMAVATGSGTGGGCLPPIDERHSSNVDSTSIFTV